MSPLRERVVLQPTVHEKMLVGINQIVDALRPTLGPVARGVAVDSMMDFKPPEILDDGATIARRIYNLPDRDADVGAMLLRHMIWRIHEHVGDGTATAAVLFQAIYAEGLRYIASGGNAMRLSHFLKEGLREIDAVLAERAAPINCKEQLHSVAEAVCGEPQLAQVLAEAFHVIGEYGRLDVRSGGRETRHELVEGFYWEGGSLSLTLVEGHQNHRVSLDDAAVLISDFEIADMRALAEVVAQVIRARIPSMMIIANSLSDAVIGFLAHVNQQPGIKVIAVKPPHENIHQRAAALCDLATLTGGQVFAQAAGQTLASVKLESLGRAKRVWTDRLLCGMVAGKGDVHAVQQAFLQMRDAIAVEQGTDRQQQLRERMGRFLGGSATLWIGGATVPEIEQRKTLAKRTAETLRVALSGGILPGGGTCFLHCRRMLCDHILNAHDLDERAAYRILALSMQAPAESILRNAGYEPGAILHNIEHDLSQQTMFDARTGTFSMGETGKMYDAAVVLREAVRASVTSAATALTIDVIVHRKGYHKDAPPQNA